MTYAEALAWWYSHANYEHRPAARGELTLDRMRALLTCLGDPQRRLRLVHVAGSKGKGSVSAMLAAVLQRAGYRTGLFTSPHLLCLEERFQIDNRPISADELAALLSDIRDVLTRKSVGTPTFFEKIATAVGFLHFVRRRVDAAVLEVGLGGRLDSTNVCLPVLSVITSISHDHTAILGDRLAQIAREKAGIIKPDRPVVSGATAPEARTVIETVARQLGARLTQLGREIQFTYTPGRVTHDSTIRSRLCVKTRRRLWPEMELSLPGEHQAANAALVVASVEELQRKGWRIPDAAVSAGLREVSWPARLEVVRRRPLVVLDCAHNVASAEALVDTLLTSFLPGRRLLIFAGSGDKDVGGMFRVLAPHFERVYLTRYTNNPRGTPPDHLLSLWQAESQPVALVCPTPAEALCEALGEAGADDLVCITGSVFLAGECARSLRQATPVA